MTQLDHQPGSAKEEIGPVRRQGLDRGKMTETEGRIRIAPSNYASDAVISLSAVWSKA